MTNFLQFYQQGGVFMHLITLFTLAATVLIAMQGLGLRDLARATLQGTQPPASATDGLTRGLMVAAVLIGVLGTMFGLMEIAGALQTVPEAARGNALLRALPIALTTMTWSLMCIIPLVLARAALHSAEVRLRRLRPA
ncbi:MAG: hypothetical protein AAGA54_36420 [Myxococcota bacterium]